MGARSARERNLKGHKEGQLKGEADDRLAHLDELVESWDRGAWEVGRELQRLRDDGVISVKRGRPSTVGAHLYTLTDLAKRYDKTRSALGRLLTVCDKVPAHEEQGASFAAWDSAFRGADNDEEAFIVMRELGFKASSRRVRQYFVMEDEEEGAYLRSVMDAEENYESKPGTAGPRHPSLMPASHTPPGPEISAIWTDLEKIMDLLSRVQHNMGKVEYTTALREDLMNELRVVADQAEALIYIASRSETSTELRVGSARS